MQHCTARPNDEVRAIDLFTSLGREGVQFRLDSLAILAASRWEQALPLPPDYTGTPIDFLSDAERDYHVRENLLSGPFSDCGLHYLWFRFCMAQT